jgi:hypothetical protein
LKMELKEFQFADVAEIQEDVNWWIKEGPRWLTFDSFSKTVDRAKAYVYDNGTYFEFKKRHVSSSCVFNFKKKSDLKTFWTALCIIKKFTEIFPQFKNLPKSFHSLKICPDLSTV